MYHQLSMEVSFTSCGLALTLRGGREGATNLHMDPLHCFSLAFRRSKPT